MAAITGMALPTPRFETVEAFFTNICIVPAADVAIDKVSPRSNADMAVPNVTDDQRSW